MWLIATSSLADHVQAACLQQNKTADCGRCSLVAPYQFLLHIYIATLLPPSDSHEHRCRQLSQYNERKCTNKKTSSVGVHHT